jgi:hypothetical protein
VAFRDVPTAVRFCADVQYQMMELDWPREVLRLPECREVRAPGGGWAFRGPRVRMGVHWAEEGSAAQHVHALTKHRVYSGEWQGVCVCGGWGKGMGMGAIVVLGGIASSRGAALLLLGRGRGRRRR